MADFDGYEGQCIGMSNFYEEVYIGQCTDNGKCGYQVTTDCKYSAWDNRTAEERKADEAKAKKSAFLAELKELLIRHNAKITSIIYIDYNSQIGHQMVADVGDDKIYFDGFSNDEVAITADNIKDYSKEEV